MEVVSVVIPTFNCETTIRVTIESILIQSGYTTEVIVVDDGSSDISCHIVEKLCVGHNNIQLIRLYESSGRPNVPRNIGIERSTGDYICFLDGDDILPLNYFFWVIPLIRDKKMFVGSLKCKFRTIPPPSGFGHTRRAKGLLIPKVIQRSKNMFSMSGLICNSSSVKSLRFSGPFLEDWRYIRRLNEIGLAGYLLYSPRIRYRVANSSLTPKSKLIQIRRVWEFFREHHSVGGAALRMPFYFLLSGVKIFFEIDLFCRP